MLYRVIGLMSGTSLDGLDIALVQFDTENDKHFNILQAETISYDKNWHKKLQKAFKLNANDLAKLDVDFGIYLGKKVLAFIKKYNLKNIDLIASHGQTVFHRPELGYTTQIGSGAHINAVTKIKTISDFRTQDVALGGQGAPLVPIGDKYLFTQYKYCLNIGGFANISYDNNGQRIAYDICPTNIVLNHYINSIGLAYDDKGKLAKTGAMHHKLLEELNRLDFYSDKKPKSLGWEFVVETIIPLIDKYNLNIPDILATYVEHIAIQISQKIEGGSMLITGGGAFNDYMISKIDEHSSSKIVIPDKTIIDFKEALIFALLGFLRVQNKINILSSVTGSSMDHSSGIIHNIYQNN